MQRPYPSVPKKRYSAVPLWNKKIGITGRVRQMLLPTATVDDKMRHVRSVKQKLLPTATVGDTQWRKGRATAMLGGKAGYGGEMGRRKSFAAKSERK